MYATFSSFDDAYQWVLSSVVLGKSVAPRGEETRECVQLGFCLTDPRRRYVSLLERRWSFAYAIAEFAWHARASRSVEEIAWYAPKWRDVSDDGRIIRGSSYGAKIFENRTDGTSQWDRVLATLKEDPSTRRAVLMLADDELNANASVKDVSCTLTVQYLVRDSKLDAFVSMRSNDAMLGLPYDVFFFSMLLEMMSNALGIPIGRYWHSATSMHLYAKDLELARRLLNSAATIFESMPSMPSATGIQNLFEAEADLRIHGEWISRKSRGHEYWTNLARVLERWTIQRRGGTGGHHWPCTPLYPHLYERLASLANPVVGVNPSASTRPRELSPK
jgi:thymidylate synthase